MSASNSARRQEGEKGACGDHIVVRCMNISPYEAYKMKTCTCKSIISIDVEDP